MCRLRFYSLKCVVEFIYLLILFSFLRVDHLNFKFSCIHNFNSSIYSLCMYVWSVSVCTMSVCQYISATLYQPVYIIYVCVYCLWIKLKNKSSFLIITWLITFHEITVKTILSELIYNSGIYVSVCEWRNIQIYSIHLSFISNGF